jgi:hypothetical protein
MEGECLMRRRADDWINATHILKVAGFDKPSRTRILEREVQKGVHEKVQGGYGKYQGKAQVQPCSLGRRILPVIQGHGSHCPKLAYSRSEIIF